MPVEAGAADRHHRRVIVLLLIGVRRLFQQRHMAGHAVVVIEEAVADEDFSLWKIRSETPDKGFGLRQRRRRPGRDPAGHRQRNEKPSETSRHIDSPCSILFCGTLSCAGGLSPPQTVLISLDGIDRLCAGTTTGYFDSSRGQPEHLPCRCKVWPLPRLPLIRQSAIYSRTFPATKAGRSSAGRWRSSQTPRAKSNGWPQNTASSIAAECSAKQASACSDLRPTNCCYSTRASCSPRPMVGEPSWAGCSRAA